jgi:hypothetical protein
MKQLLLYPIFLILICACIKLNVEIPDTGRKLVINGLITTDSLINVRISRSEYFTSGMLLYSYPEFDSAVVRFYKNNIYLDSLHYSNNITYSDIYPNSNYWSNDVYPLQVNEYKIIVKRPGFPDATATTTIPKLVNIDRVDTSRIILVPGSGPDFRINCRVEFTDPAVEKNYYLFNIVTRTLPLGKRYMEFDCHDPVVEEEISYSNKISGVAFTDKLIDGKKYYLNVSFNGYYYRSYSQNAKTSYIYYFRLYSITEEYYKFIQTLNLYNATHSNPLAEPVMVYSNVSGGYGIFSGAAVSTDSIILHD